MLNWLARRRADGVSRSAGILFVSPWLQGGGIEQQLELKAGWFARRGYRVEIMSWFVADELSGRPNPMLEAFRDQGIPVRRLRTCTNRMQLVQLAVQVAARAASGRFSLIVGHELAANLVAIAAKLLLANQVRVIAEIHNSSDMYVETRLSGITIWLARALYPYADGILAVSNTVGADASAFFRLDRGRIATIYNPFRLGEIHQLAADRPPDDLPVGPFIVACGRLVRMKGFIELIETFSRIRHRVAADLVILGEGPLRTELERCAQANGVADRVRLPGFVSNPFAYFARAGVFVLSSMLKESFSRALVEAMACGVPVIASRCGGPEEILGDGRYGFLYPIGDMEALAAGIVRILERPGEAAELATAARRRAAEWSEEKILPRIEAFYFARPGDDGPAATPREAEQHSQRHAEHGAGHPVIPR
jgi:glycosyltransferase involved in cell wall biosynthesis